MNRIATMLHAGVLATLMALSSACSAQPGNALGVTNGGFEQDRSSPPAGWRLEERLATKGTADIREIGGSQALTPISVKSGAARP